MDDSTEGTDAPPPIARLGERPWLVLGGGGLKGLSHIGAWRALVEAGVQPSGIVGTSIGALIAVLVSSGRSWEWMRERALRLERPDIVTFNRRAAFINGIKQVSVFKGDPMLQFFGELLPEDGWTACKLPVYVNAVDLADGSTVWFGPDERTDVSVAEAVYASSALPVFYPPLRKDGRAFVDGGSAHPLALFKAADEGASGVIGIDPGSGEVGDVEKVLRQGMLSVHQRIFSIMTYRRRRDLLAQWDGPPLLYVRPRLDGYATFDFENIEYFIDEGYRAMTEALG